MPEYGETTGPEVADLCREFGFELDPWQCDVVADGLGELGGGRWAAAEVGLVVPRQNGKSEVLIARMLAGLFLLGEEEIIYSSHRADTSMKIFQRFVKYLRRNPDIDRQIKAKQVRVINTNGQEGVTLASGQSVGFRTRAQEGGRGFSADCIIFDEAFELSEDLHAAILPTLVARPNPQVWYVGTPVDRQVHKNGVVFARIRQRGLDSEPKLAYFEWSADADIEHLDREMLDSPAVWAACNPSLGYQANIDMIAMLRSSMKARKFATECLCIGDWPDTSDESLHVIDLARWDDCTDLESEPSGPLCFAFDVTPDGSAAAIGVGGYRPDELVHCDVECGKGTAWVAPRLADLKRKHRNARFLCDASGPAGAILADVEAAVGEVHKVSAQEHAAAFGCFKGLVAETKEIRHRGAPELRAALEGASTRPMGDGGQAWSRKNSGVDISPLVTVTLAAWAAKAKPPKKAPRFVSLGGI